MNSINPTAIYDFAHHIPVIDPQTTPSELLSSFIEVQKKLLLLHKEHENHPNDVTIIIEIILSYWSLETVENIPYWSQKGLQLYPETLFLIDAYVSAQEQLGEHAFALAMLLRAQHLPQIPALHHQKCLAFQWMWLNEPQKAIAIQQPMILQLLQNHEERDSAFFYNLVTDYGVALLKNHDAFGFIPFESRLHGEDFSYNFNQIARYQYGDSIANKRVVVSHTLGFGDQLLFFALILDWVAQGAQLLITCDQLLYSLLRASLPPEVQIVIGLRADALQALPPADLQHIVNEFKPHLQINLLQLPWLKCHLRQNIAKPTPLSLHLPHTFDQHVPISPQSFFTPYIKPSKATQQQAAFWRQSLKNKHPKKMLVGIFWDCEQRYMTGLGIKPKYWAMQRSIPIELICEFVTHPEIIHRIHFVNLQLPLPYATHIEDDKWQGNLSHFDQDFSDFEMSASCVDQLDLIISVDASIANLSVMMGKETWVLATASSDWRWGLQGDTAPWFEHVKVFRQRLPNRWAGVLTRVGDALIEHYTANHRM